MKSFTPNEVARMFRVDWRKVIGWIDSGKLPAVNTGVKRPNYKIFQDGIDALKAILAVRQPEPVRRKREKAKSFPSLADMKDVG